MHTNEALSTTADAHSLERVPSGFRPWEDRARPVEERLQAYKEHVAREVEAMMSMAEKLSSAEFQEFERSPATQELMTRAERLTTMTTEEFRWQFDGRCRELLGKNFLGAEEWKAAFGVDVGSVPPIPASITEELLESACPLHLGGKIKNTHVLVLVPKSVNGEPFTVTELHRLCTSGNEPGQRGIHPKNLYCLNAQFSNRCESEWATTPVAESSWVLMPKRDPDPTKVIKEKHFRHKTIAEQQKVLEDHYPDYRESGACEVITAVLLCYRMHKEELLSGSQLRCKESTRFGKRATVGNFIPEGLRLDTGLNDLPIEFEGRALARKL